MCIQLATLVIYANKTIVNLALKRLLNDRLLAKVPQPRTQTHTYIYSTSNQRISSLPPALAVPCPVVACNKVAICSIRIN